MNTKRFLQAVSPTAPVGRGKEEDVCRLAMVVGD